MNKMFRPGRPYGLHDIQKQYITETHATLVIILTFFLLEVLTAQAIPPLNESGDSSALVAERFICNDTNSYCNLIWTIMKNATGIDDNSSKIIQNNIELCNNETRRNCEYNSINSQHGLKFPEIQCWLPNKWVNISLTELNRTDLIDDCEICGSIDVKLTYFKMVSYDISRIYYSDKSHKNYETGYIIIEDSSGYQHDIVQIVQHNTFIEIYYQNLTLHNIYNISLEYYDADKPYCHYKTFLSAHLKDLKQRGHHIQRFHDISTRLKKPKMFIRSDETTNINNIEQTTEDSEVIQIPVEDILKEEQEVADFTLNWILIILLSLTALIITYIVLKHKAFQKILYKVKKCLNIPEELEEFPKCDIYRITSPKRSIHQETNCLYPFLENIYQIPPTVTDYYEFARDKVELKVEIGNGAFGKVYYAKAHGLYNPQGYAVVAVKVLRDKAPKEEVQDFLSEIEMLKRVTKHRNVVRMFACVTKSQPYMMIMELVLSGNLKEYLLDLREIWSQRVGSCNQFFKDTSDCTYIQPGNNYKRIKKEQGTSYIIRKNAYKNTKISKLPQTDEVPLFKNEDKSPLPEEMINLAEPVLDNKELENFALQIASGMAHLEKLGIIHRDLAARNVLVTRSKILKISDFGMSKLGTYVYKSEKRLPLRWLAIETLEKYTADSKSDVWSFGVVLWEIGTLGAFPYGRLENNLVLLYLKTGKRLLRPKICTDDLYSLMLRCWAENPDERPSFKDLVNILAKKSSVYVEFSQINSTYKFPGPVTLEDDDEKNES